LPVVSVARATLLACMVAVNVFVPSNVSKATEPPKSPANEIVAPVVKPAPAAPLRAAALKLVVKFPVVPVMSPANVISSLNDIALPPVFELNASAYTVPVALTLPDTVRASFGVMVPTPTLPPV